MLQAAPGDRANGGENEDSLRILPVAEYFPQVIADIATAKRYIFVKIPTWRNDQAGREFADAILKAAKSGVKVLIVNDAQGSFFEYAEGNGQAFFHDAPGVARIFQARAMATLYGHQPDWPMKNPMKEASLNHPNIEIIENLAIYDHSKVVVIDGQTAFVGGANIGNDFHPSYGPDGERMVDYMARLSGRDATQKVLQACRGDMSPESASPGSADLKVFHNSTIQPAQVGFFEFVQGAKGALTIAVPFHTQRRYIGAIADRLAAQQSVTLMTPEHPTTRHYGNQVFLRDLVQATTGFHEFLQIAMHPNRVHAKAAYDDQRVFIGSENWAMAGHVAETSVSFHDAPARAALKKLLDAEIQNCRTFTGAALGQFLDVPVVHRVFAGMEDWVVDRDARRCVVHQETITAARSHSNKRLKALLAQFP